MLWEYDSKCEYSRASPWEREKFQCSVMFRQKKRMRMHPKYPTITNQFIFISFFRLKSST